MKFKNLIFIAAAMVIVWTAVRCEAAISMFLHIDGVAGDSTAVGHTADSDVTDFSFGMQSNSPNPYFTFSVDKNVNVASPTLALNCATGVSNASATLSCYRTGSSGLVLFYSITVSNVFVSSVSTSASAGGTSPTENINLNFNSIQWTYIPQNPNGSSGTPIVTSYRNH